MANPPRRSSAPTTPWRTFQEPSPPPSGSSVGGTLGALAIAVGLGVLGAKMLDLHGHTCERCGRRWRHFGAFNLGDEPSHTCSRCGEIQWWKCGVPHVLRGSQFVESPSNPALPPVPPAFAPPVMQSAFAPPVPPAYTPPVGAIRANATPSPTALPPSRAPLLAIQARRTLR